MTATVVVLVILLCVLLHNVLHLLVYLRSSSSLAFGISETGINILRILLRVSYPYFYLKFLMKYKNIVLTFPTTNKFELSSLKVKKKKIRI